MREDPIELATRLSLSRRRFLSSAALIGVSTLLPHERAEAQGALALADAGVVTETRQEMSVAIEAAVITANDRRAEARMKGYEGESCSECGNFTMVRNGTCLKCDTCGSTSGCS